MSNNQKQSSQPILRSVVLPQGTHLCPVCGDAFPLHTAGVVDTCHRCSARVELLLSASTTTTSSKNNTNTSSSSFDPIVAMKRKAEEANSNFARGGHKFRANELVAEEQKKDTRQTEDALCDKCGQVRKCHTHALQIRGADEGQTIFYECSHCHHQWSLNS